MGRCLSTWITAEMIFSSPYIFSLVSLFQRLDLHFRFPGDIAQVVPLLPTSWSCLSGIALAPLYPASKRSSTRSHTFGHLSVSERYCLSSWSGLIFFVWMSLTGFAFVSLCSPPVDPFVFSKCKDIEPYFFNTSHHVLLFPLSRIKYTINPNPAGFWNKV